MPGFGRRFAPDDRDRAYLMRRQLKAAQSIVLPVRKTWRIASGSLDQGDTGTCVGFAWRNFLRCAPLRTERTGPSAFVIYREAILRDPWPDNDVERELPDWDPGLQSGTTVRAGAKALLGFGGLHSILWAFDLQPALEWLLTKGPVVIGVNWYSSFMRPDHEGIIKITPTARVDGGHAILVRGADTRRGLARLSNSWGDEWGISGECLLPLRDLERLIHEDGEVATAVQQKLAPKLFEPPPQFAFVVPSVVPDTMVA